MRIHRLVVSPPPLARPRPRTSTPGHIIVIRIGSPTVTPSRIATATATTTATAASSHRRSIARIAPVRRPWPPRRRPRPRTTAHARHPVAPLKVARQRRRRRVPLANAHGDEQRACFERIRARTAARTTTARRARRRTRENAAATVCAAAAPKTRRERGACGVRRILSGAKRTEDVEM